MPKKPTRRIGGKKRKQKRSTKKRRRKIRSRYIFRFSLPVDVLKIAAIVLVTAFLTTFYQVFLKQDERAVRINKYFSAFNAPLAGHGYTFIKIADSCDMDWRLLPAIAMQESTGGKFMQNNNPFGWGSAEIPFGSLDEAIIEVGSHLCGNKSETSQWYAATSTYEKLYWYNGTVNPRYPAEVLWIMEQI